MSTLLEDVTQGLVTQGLNVEEDRGGLVVRGGEGNHTVTVWIDETERVVRAEEVLCYPVDDFSEELCVAMDQLNEARLGLTISYQEQQRALVASTVWTSPSRSPSANQLHLLIGLLHEAKARDSDALTRIADGDASWFDVADQLVGSATGRLARPPVEKFVSTEPPTRAFGDASWGEPATRDMDDGDGGDAQPRGIQRGQTSSFDAEEFKPKTPPKKKSTARRTRPPRDESQPVRKTSRLAFQMAVNAAAPKELARVDMTAEGRTFGSRLLRGFFYLLGFAFVVGLVLHFGHTFRPDIFSWDQFFGEEVVQRNELEDEYKRRKAMGPGRALLGLELSDPRDFKPVGGTEDFVQLSLQALGEKKGPTLEDLITKGANEAARKRAYQLWRTERFHEKEGARLKLVKALADAKRRDDAIVSYIANDLRETPPSEELAIEALTWAPPVVWRVLVEQLGTPGEGAEKRAEALAKQLDKETEDAAVLSALINTGHAPPDALAQLVSKRKLEWAKGEGRELIVELVKKEPNQTEGLMSDVGDIDRQVFAAELLTEANTPESNKRLLRILKDRGGATRVRLAATYGVRKNALAEATWTLVLIVCGTKEEKPLRDAAERALEKIPPPKAVEELKKYLAPDQKYNVRHYAVRGLGVVDAPSAVLVLIDMLKQDDDPKIRRLAAKVLEDYLGSDEGRTSLNRGLGVFREVARRDKDAAVRSAAKRLYDSLTGG